MGTTYRATVQRDGSFWLIKVDGIGATQARHLRELGTMATDLITVMTGVEPTDVEIDFDIILPDSVRSHLERAAHLREESAQAQTLAAAEVRAAARDLAERGLPLRDIGRVLRVSYQRAHQLVR